MKIYRYFFLFVAVPILGFFSSCSLEEDTSSFSSPKDFFRTYSECQSVVNGCYMPLKGIFTLQYMLATECTTDLSFSYSGTRDSQLDISPAVPRFGQNVWTQSYLGVQRCNFALNGILQSPAFSDENGVVDEDNPQRIQLICEVKTLRAFYYYTLTSFFGDVPFYFDDVTDMEVLEKIAVLPRMSAVDTRNKCIEDLQGIAPLASQTRTCDNEEHRLGAACAYMLIAKLAMWNERWETAVEALKQLETIYGDFSGYPYESNIRFRDKNKPESIMEIQHTYTAGGLAYTATLASLCTPKHEKMGECIYDGVEITELGSEATTYTPMKPTTYFCTVLQPEKGKDIRAHYNMAWSYNGHRFKSVSSQPWCGPKFWCPNMNGNRDGNNYTVFRYADVILMLAECYNELNEDELSVEYLNKVRRRAQLPDYVYRTHERLTDEIRCERGRELFGEFQRKFDLVRWGVWYETVVQYNDNPNLQNNIKPCHRYYPIPDTEVVYSKYNLDNKEYEQYGL